MWKFINQKHLINVELINKIQEKWKSDRKDKKDTITKIKSTYILLIIIDTINSKIEIFESHIKIIKQTLNEGLEDTIKKHIKFEKDNKNQLKENRNNKAKLEKEIRKYNEVVLEYNKSLSEIDKEKFKKKIGAFKETEIQYSYLSNLKIQAEGNQLVIRTFSDKN